MSQQVPRDIRRRSPQGIIVGGKSGARDVDRIETERMDAIWSQREILESAEKRSSLFLFYFFIFF